MQLTMISCVFIPRFDLRIFFFLWTSFTHQVIKFILLFRCIKDYYFNLYITFYFQPYKTRAIHIVPTNIYETMWLDNLNYEIIFPIFQVSTWHYWILFFFFLNNLPSYLWLMSLLLVLYNNNNNCWCQNLAK